MRPWYILLALLWILLALWPAAIANRKGHSFIGFLILGLIFWPATLVAAFLVRDRGRPYAVRR
ncbi:hypothetical protein [Rhizomonospora bruguierae]|uniref:hypothetical protein n=1 Tax=Rhizomonospora bruguierae TaxID=1581705 RepID=UPI001BCF7A23|nr:hypothetical protein [Micromonospora sp. NBRC 107566]